MNEKVTMGDNVDKILKDNKCSIYKIENETGEGIMTSYEVFKGVYILYNDFHIKKCEARLQVRDDVICIDHCREGRIEWEISSDKWNFYLIIKNVLISINHKLQK